jgi:hypothetical protein
MRIRCRDTMPRRLKLSPLQRDIVVTLEDGGAESIGAVIATVRPWDEVEFTRSVDGLIELGSEGRNERRGCDSCLDGRVAVREYQGSARAGDMDL